MAIEFSIDRTDLVQALKSFFGRRARGKDAELDYVDIKAQENEVEFITTGFSSSVEAEVASPGCARFPFPHFETLFRNPQKLAWTSAGRLSIRITEGQSKLVPPHSITRRCRLRLSRNESQTFLSTPPLELHWR